MTGLTDNEVKFLQERFAASKAGLEAATQPWFYDDDGDVMDSEGFSLFELVDATAADANYVVAVVNLMPRLLAHYLELRSRPDSDTDKEQDR